jgi:hypothetical protein
MSFPPVPVYTPTTTQQRISDNQVAGRGLSQRGLGHFSSVSLKLHHAGNRASSMFPG